jgi:peptidoglycan/LPS O-acetylase OafA/YrhL
VTFRAGEKGYFRYIDGLRALSIVAVVLFHLDPRLLPGGFAGVDIFFVVSGFIISGSLHGRIFSGVVDLFALFYTRRFRRIVPALLFMLITASLLVVIFIPEADLSHRIGRTALSAFFGFSNVRLAHGTDYFFPLAQFNPFTHTWSLAVEEQFYVLFPMLFYLLTNRRTAIASTVALLALCIVSFGYGFIEPRMPINLGFYSSPSRFWEIGSGILLYVTLAGTDRFEPRTLPELSLVTYAGMLVAVAGFVAGNPQSYPVPGAVLPVLGALLMIVGLHGRLPTSLPGKLLTSRGAMWIGLISYSLYLWHWPVFSLFRWTIGFSDPWHKLLALGVALAMSLVSYVWVEVPLRTSRRLREPIRAIPVYLAAVLLLGWGAHWLFGNARFFSASTVTAHRADWDAAPDPRSRAPGHCQLQIVAKAFHMGEVTELTRARCDSPTATSKLFVIGDSHALVFGPLLTDYTVRTGNRVALYWSACGFLRIPRLAPGCAAFRDRVIDDVAHGARPGDVVFLPSLRVPRFRNQWDQQELDTSAAWQAINDEFDAGLAEALSILHDMSVPGVHFVFVLPPPIFKTPLFRCADWFNRMNPACDGGTETERRALEQYRQPVVAFADALQKRADGLTIWDPFPILCPGATCSMWRDGKPLFYDTDHISVFANRLLLDPFMAMIEHTRAQQGVGMTQKARRSLRSH